MKWEAARVIHPVVAKSEFFAGTSIRGRCHTREQMQQQKREKIADRGGKRKLAVAKRLLIDG
jgi:hypothetical protein